MAFGPPAFVSGQNIVPRLPQLFNRGQREILVLVETCHRLCGLVLGNLPLNLIPMHARIGPRVG